VAIIDYSVQNPAAGNIKTIFRNENYVQQVRETDNWISQQNWCFCTTADNTSVQVRVKLRTRKFIIQ
jgi:hypothetical protein